MCYSQKEALCLVEQQVGEIMNIRISKHDSLSYHLFLIFSRMRRGIAIGLWEWKLVSVL
jgi:hypothetical protein